MEVYSYSIILIGAWIQVLGAGIVSIGNTLVALEEKGELIDEVGGDLYAIGNAIEATGDSLQAIGRTNLSSGKQEEMLGVLGSWLQAAGNASNVLGGSQALSLDEDEGLSIDIIGGVVQTIGAGFEAQGSSLSKSAYASLITTGLTIQTYALSIETIGLLFIKRKRIKLGEKILALGSYAQTAGAIIAAIGYSKEFQIKF
ncbi:hypothetical protein GLW07_12210 [Bacillus hwajinpoensis]|uniref:Uncharacterized protein n=1 Tax=Guptibacillus hwajinpoensis TaxID=208199 RepID=A0A845F053_9BACL|nr:hypothetical protein [Pseudalkalibacillus hwajinpoensis]MYL64116.1 hypothetical protein [Pseudalkalibacillus hwajinpoensis]